MKNEAATKLGALGGKVTSDAKAKAVAENGRKGGRPRNDGKPVQRERLTNTFEVVDGKRLPDYWYLLAKNAEDALLLAGASPGVDYNMMDLFKLAEPLLLHRWQENNDDLDLVIG